MNSSETPRKETKKVRNAVGTKTSSIEVVDEDGEGDDGRSEQKEGDVPICKSIIDDEDGEDDEEGTEQKEGGVPTFKSTVKGITYNSSHDKEEKDNKTNPESGGCIGGEHTHGEICKGLHGFFLGLRYTKILAILVPYKICFPLY